MRRGPALGVVQDRMPGSLFSYMRHMCITNTPTPTPNYYVPNAYVLCALLAQTEDHLRLCDGHPATNRTKPATKAARNCRADYENR